MGSGCHHGDTAAAEEEVVRWGRPMLEPAGRDSALQKGPFPPELGGEVTGPAGGCVHLKPQDTPRWHG